MSKMSQESQVNLNFADYDKLGLRLSAISISPQSEERQFWPVGCPWAGCKIGRHQNLLTSPHFQKSDSVHVKDESWTAGLYCVPLFWPVYRLSRVNRERHYSF